MKLLLVCEGSSDAALLPHIRDLVASHRQVDLESDFWYQGRRLADKIRNGLDNLGACDLLLAHRDADRAGPEERYREIADAVREVGYGGPWVGIVPVRMTEAWLLLDAGAIRQAAGNPHSRNNLALPRPQDVEKVRDPKADLERALLAAGENRGRRLRKSRKEFPRLRRRLLENLPPGGPLEQVKSWARFRDDAIAALPVTERPTQN